jgi:hypothetical protein
MALARASAVWYNAVLLIKRKVVSCLMVVDLDLIKNQQRKSRSKRGRQVGFVDLTDYRKNV